ncbi:MAG TPA: hypothetical protein VLE23_20385 [Geminicoccaceae bacterium]|nr:hypothetical protein [Geminicoccaceae bacterium]
MSASRGDAEGRNPRELASGAVAYGERALLLEPTADASRLGTTLALLGIVAGALLLRLHNLEQWGLWDDELFSVQHAIELADGLVDGRVLAWLPHLIGFELAGVDMASLDPAELWTWRAAGTTEWNMRAPVALLGALSIAVLGLVGQRTLGARPTLWLCLLLALPPWHLWMSQVCRFYMQLFLFYNLAVLLYYQATTDGRVARASVAMLCLVLAVYTSPIALMIFGVFAVDIASSWLRRRPTGMRPAFWAMGAATIAICAISVVAKFDLGSEPEAVLTDYSEFTGTPQSIPVMTMGMVYLIEVHMVVIAALGFWALLRRNERLAILLAAAAVVPLATFIGFNLLGKDTHARYTFVALFAWLALGALGIEVIFAALRPHLGTLASTLPALALLGTFALTDYIYMTGGAGYRGLWRQAAAYIEAHRRPGELVAGDWAGQRMLQYYLAEPDAVLLPHGFSDADMRALVPRPAWILLRAYHPSAGDRTEQLAAAGALQAYFTNRVAQPNHTINVYHHTPGVAPAAASPSAAGDSWPRRRGQARRSARAQSRSQDPRRPAPAAVRQA